MPGELKSKPTVLKIAVLACAALMLFGGVVSAILGLKLADGHLVLKNSTPVEEVPPLAGSSNEEAKWWEVDFSEEVSDSAEEGKLWLNGGTAGDDEKWWQLP